MASFNKKMDRRQFLKEMALVGGAALASPVKGSAQEGKNRVPEITILYYTVIAEQDDIWKLVTQDWKKLGLEIKLKVAAFAVVQKTSYYTDRNFDITSISWGPTNERLDPNFHLEEHFHSRNKEIGSRNYGHYVNPEFDKYCDLQKAELDKNKRREYVWKCQKILARDYPAWYFGYSSNIQAYNSRDWEGVVAFPGNGIGGFLSPWTYLNIRSKTKRNTIRVAVGSVNTGLNPFAPQHIGQEGQLRFI